MSRNVLFGNIKALCDRDGITIYQLEKKLSLTQHSLKKCENTAVSWERLVPVADYFDVSVDFLIGRTNNPKAHKANILPTTALLMEASENRKLSLKKIKFVIKMMDILNEFDSF